MTMFTIQILVSTIIHTREYERLCPLNNGSYWVLDSYTIVQPSQESSPTTSPKYGLTEQLIHYAQRKGGTL